MSLLLHVTAWVVGISVISLPTWLLDSRCPCFLCLLSHPFNPMRPIIIQFHIYGNFYAGDYIDIHDNLSASFYQGQHSKKATTRTATIEDVTPIVEHEPCPFLVPERLTELGLYTMEQFETMFREAVESDAKTLAAFLKKYKQLCVLDFKGMGKKQIFVTLRAYFPTMRRYSYRNFIAYF